MIFTLNRYLGSPWSKHSRRVRGHVATISASRTAAPFALLSH
jgi:hypothetical protein